MSQAGIIQSNTSVGATTYTTSAGNAAPAAGVLTIVGANGNTTSAAGGTVTITAPNQTFELIKVTLTSAEIKNLSITPITVISAKGANTVITPVFINSQFIYGGTDPFIGGDIIHLNYNGISIADIGPVITNTELDGAANAFYSVAQGGVGAEAVGEIDNVDVIITCAAPYLGNVTDDNFLIVQVGYFVSTLT